MAATNIGLRDWLLGWIIPNPKAGGTGTVGIQAVTLVDTTGAPVTGGGGGSVDATIVNPIDAHGDVKMVIYDSAGNPLTYNVNGPATMANSSPVTLASDQTNVVVQWKAETTDTPAGVALTANTSATLLAANASRIRTIIYNPLATTLFVRKAAAVATATAGGYDVAIPSLSTWFSDPYEYAGQIRGICATAGSVNVSESV